MEKRSYTPVLIMAALFGFVGPQLSVPQDRAAGAPFAYMAPDGFVEQLPQATPGKRTWVFQEDGARSTPNINLSHTDKKGRVEEPELAALAKDMPKVFAGNGIAWTEMRHETRARVDGAHVGLIEGAGESFGLRYRIVQLAFPDDTGTSIVTASIPSDSAARWVPQIESSVATSTGVALRVPPPPAWVYALWALAGAVLAYLALSIGGRARRHRSIAPPPPPPSSGPGQREASGSS